MNASGDDGAISSLPQEDQDAIGVTLLVADGGLSRARRRQARGRLHGGRRLGERVRHGEEGWRGDRGVSPRALIRRQLQRGALKAPPATSLRVLTPDVVLVSAHLQVAGQKLVGGGEIEVRDNHSLRVLQRQGDGSWLIVSEMYNDANREQTYEGRSSSLRGRRRRPCVRLGPSDAVPSTSWRCRAGRPRVTVRTELATPAPKSPAGPSDPHISANRRWTRRSGVSSGWKDDASTGPWRTSTGTPSSVASTSTSSATETSSGARMKTVGRGGPSPEPNTMSASKDCLWRP